MVVNVLAIIKETKKNANANTERLGLSFIS